MLTNEQMKPGRFAKLARGRKLFARMVACWNAGGTVSFGTALRVTHVKPAARDMIKLGASGSLYMQSGKKWVCIDYCAFLFTA